MSDAGNTPNSKPKMTVKEAVTFIAKGPRKPGEWLKLCEAYKVLAWEYIKEHPNGR